MHIIPVIDLLNGQVVHAKRGDRQHYMPILSSLCASSAALEVVNGLLELYPFKRMYIADINAIQKNGDNFPLISAMQQHYPWMEFWLDAGFSEVSRLKLATDNGLQAVIGSESVADIHLYDELSAACANQHILSLDFMAHGHNDRFHGPQELFHAHQHWPHRIIAMTLRKVGSNSGPDIACLASLLNTQTATALPPCAIYAAGGVRGRDDLLQLSAMSIAGALVASALHSGALSASMIAEAENMQ